MSTNNSVTSVDQHPGHVIELNVGGVVYATTSSTLTRDPNSLLTQMFSSLSLQPNISDANDSTQLSKSSAARAHKDSKGRYFIDRDGVLFRYVLDYLRNGKLVLPECFHERDRLRQEADYFRLTGMSSCLQQSDSTLPVGGSLSPAAVDITTVPTTLATGSSGREPGYIVVGYRGTFAFGRDGGVADVKFRKLWRILVSGRVSLCREVFRDTLNESRDVDRGDGDRYTARFFLKHTFIEQAFDALHEAGFRMVGACGSGTNSAGDVKPGMDTEESKWNHYNEFAFCRY